MPSLVGSIENIGLKSARHTFWRALDSLLGHIDAV